MSIQIDVLKKEIEDFKQKNHNLSKLLSNIEDLIILIDYNGNYISIIPTSPKYLGLPVEELIGQNINDQFEENTATKIITSIQKAIDTNSIQEIQYPLFLNNKQKYFNAVIKPNSNNEAIAIIKDITVQKENEIHLKTIIKKYETILNSTFEGIIIHENGKVSFVNDAILKITGYNREELVGSNLLEKIPFEEDQSTIMQQMQKQSTKQYYVTGKKKTGEYFIAEVEGKNILTENEKLRIVAIRDVTVRIKMKNELKRSQERLKTIYDFAPISIWEEDFSLVYDYIKKLKSQGITNFSEYFDNHPQDVKKCINLTKVIDCNKTTLEIYQVPNKEILFKDLSKVLTTESYNNFKKQLIAISEGEHYIESIIKNRTFLGNTITVSMRWNVVPEYQDTYKRVLVTILDITRDQKVKVAKEILYDISNAFTQSDNLNTLSAQVKLHLGKLFNTDNFYIALLNNTSDTFQIIYQEDQYDKIDSFPAKKTLTKYIIDQNKPMIIKEDEQLELMNKGIIGDIGEISKVWMGTPLYDNKEIIGAIAVQSYCDSNAYTNVDLEIFQFIAEKISSLIVQKKSQDELKIVQHRLDTATSMLRHDISNDLSVIKSALKLYRQSNQSNFLDEIDKRIKKSLSLIEYHRNQEQVINTHSNLKEYNIKDVLSKIIPSYPNVQINIDGDITIYADDAIYSVFENLIFNSIKHGKADVINISLKHSNGSCEIFYRDNGKGIDRVIKDKIFEKGISGKDTGNTGMGLYIIKRIIESYSGEIYYLEQEKKGATFIIKLHCPIFIL